MTASIFLVLTSAIAIDGAILRAGSLVEVSEREAKNFLHRGKARLATVEDGAPEASAESDGADDERDVNLDRLNKNQLSELAIQLSIEPGEMTKAQLVDAIEAKQEAN